MTGPPKRELTDSCYHAEHGICPALHLEKPEERCPCFCHEHGGKGFPAPDPPTAEPDAVERAGEEIRRNDPEFAMACLLLREIITKAQRAGHAAGRAEALKPLREIYARGRVTFRSDGYPNSVDEQDAEFRRALDESGEDCIDKPRFTKEKQNDKSNDPRPGPVPKRDDEYR